MMDKLEPWLIMMMMMMMLVVVVLVKGDFGEVLTSRGLIVIMLQQG